MPPMKQSQIVAKEVEEMLRKHITDLGEFLESLGFTETNSKEFVIETEKGETEGSIRYIVYKASDTSTPLWSKTI